MNLCTNALSFLPVVVGFMTESPEDSTETREDTKRPAGGTQLRKGDKLLQFVFLKIKCYFSNSLKPFLSQFCYFCCCFSALKCQKGVFK